MILLTNDSEHTGDLFSPSLTGFVEGKTDDIALSMLSKMRTVSVWTSEVFETVFVAQPCVM